MCAISICQKKEIHRLPNVSEPQGQQNYDKRPTLIISSPYLPCAISRNAMTVGLSFDSSIMGVDPTEICLALAVAARVILNRLGIFSRQSSTVILAMVDINSSLVIFKKCEYVRFDKNTHIYLVCYLPKTTGNLHRVIAPNQANCAINSRCPASCRIVFSLSARTIQAIC